MDNTINLRNRNMKVDFDPIREQDTLGGDEARRVSFPCDVDRDNDHRYEQDITRHQGVNLNSGEQYDFVQFHDPTHDVIFSINTADLRMAMKVLL